MKNISQPNLPLQSDLETQQNIVTKSTTAGDQQDIVTTSTITAEYSH